MEKEKNEMDLIIRLTGEVQESNFPVYKEACLASIANINTDLETDEHFAQAEKDIKKCKTAEDTISEAKAVALDKTASIRELFEAMNEVEAKLKEIRLGLEKAVKAKKSKIKADIVAKGPSCLAIKMGAVTAHPAALDGFKIVTADFDNAVKGKKKIETMQKAVDDLVEDYLSRFKEYCLQINENKQILEPYLELSPSLFSDETKLLQMEKGALIEVLVARADKYRAEQRELKRKAKEEAEAEIKQNDKVKKDEPSNLIKPSLSPKKINPAINESRHSDPANIPENTDSTGDSYIMTVIMACKKEKAIEIAQAINNNLERFGDAVVSVNLNKGES